MFIVLMNFIRVNLGLRTVDCDNSLPERQVIAIFISILDMCLLLFSLPSTDQDAPYAEIKIPVTTRRIQCLSGAFRKEAEKRIFVIKELCRGGRLFLLFITYVTFVNMRLITSVYSPLLYLLG